MSHTYFSMDHIIAFYEWITSHYMQGPHLLYPFLIGVFGGYFYLLIIKNINSMNICLQVFMQT